MTTIAESHTAHFRGKKVPAYAATQGIMMAIIFLSVALLAAIGPEFKGRAFEKAAALGEVTPDKMTDLDELERQESSDQKTYITSHVEETKH